MTKDNLKPEQQQPKAIANGKPITSTMPISQDLNSPIRTTSRWRSVFIVLGILQAAGVSLFLVVMLWAMQQARSGVSGTEFIALLLFVTVVPAVTAISLVNIIGLPIYMIKQKPKGKGLILCVISLVISALLVAYGAYNVYGMTVSQKNFAEKLRQETEEEDRQFAAENANPEITKEEAIKLLNECKLNGFYYTNQSVSENLQNVQFPSPESSSTGIVLVRNDGIPRRISIADRLIPELVPIARNAQKSCRNLQFWHDGSYERFKEGKWYFKDEIVNNMETGKTKEEAINFMKNCKADYFVGYTDINLIKDESTKAWLNKAEKSSTGIEISDNSTKTYVFTSKQMTGSLQDAARQFRQACYGTKKLYISVDNWIETEYPAGKWTRVKQ